MPVTKGAGNPDWTRDETILALDLYLKHGRKLLDQTHPDVIALSTFLRALPLYAESVRKESFRNPHGVRLKIQNLDSARRKLDLEESPKISTSRMDLAVWKELGNQPAQAAILAQMIRDGAKLLTASEVDTDDEQDEEVFSEGRLLTRLHAKRERSKDIRAKAIKSARKSGPLSCKACEKSELTHLGRVAESMFEVHHIRPLSSLVENQTQTTRLSDVAILCADCHRLIHRLIRDEKAWITPEALQVRLRTELA